MNTRFLTREDGEKFENALWECSQMLTSELAYVILTKITESIGYDEEKDRVVVTFTKEFQDIKDENND